MRDHRRARALALPLDILAVLTFVVIGRTSHDDGLSLSGVAVTAAPFLIGLGVAWALVYLTQRVVFTDQRFHFPPERLWPHGVAIWVFTVIAGISSRHLFGQSAPFSFQVVTTIFLGLMLIGWRGVAAWLARRATPVTAR